MWTSDETVVTTTSITTVSVSTRKAQSTESVPELNQESTGTRSTRPSPSPTVMKATQERIAETTRTP